MPAMLLFIAGLIAAGLVTYHYLPRLFESNLALGVVNMVAGLTAVFAVLWIAGTIMLEPELSLYVPLSATLMGMLFGTGWTHKPPEGVTPGPFHTIRACARDIKMVLHR